MALIVQGKLETCKKLQVSLHPVRDQHTPRSHLGWENVDQHAVFWCDRYITATKLQVEFPFMLDQPFRTEVSSPKGHYLCAC